MRPPQWLGGWFLSLREYCMSFCAVVWFGSPHPLSRAKCPLSLSFYSLHVCVSSPKFACGGGGGWRKIKGRTETLVFCKQDLPYGFSFESFLLNIVLKNAMYCPFLGSDEGTTILASFWYGKNCYFTYSCLAVQCSSFRKNNRHKPRRLLEK